MRIGKERCERKAYPHRVYPDRNHIQLCVKGALPRDFLQTPGNYYLSLTIAKIQRLKKLNKSEMVY